MRLRWLGGTVFACFSIHAVDHLLHGHPYELLWACNVGTLLLALGLWSARARLVAIAVSWLVLGNPTWLFSLWSGDSLMTTSLLTHVGGIVLGCVGLRWLGFPRGTWWRAVLLAEALRLVCRLLTPRAANINVSWDIYPGFERYFPTYRLYWLSLMALLVGSFVLTELLFRRALRWHPPTPAASPRA